MSKRYPKAERKREARREDLQWMAASGESAVNAAKRLGMTYHGLENWAKKNALDVRKTLVANNPRDHNVPGGRTLAAGRFHDNEVA